MTALPRLSPAFTGDRLFPVNAAYMARTDHHQTRLLGIKPYNLDSITLALMGLLNGCPTVRHRSGVTDAALALLERAGLTVSEDMRIYEDEVQAERHGDDLISEGYKLFWPYPLRESRFPTDGHIVPPELWLRLNAKRYLSRLVPASNIAPREILPLERMTVFCFKHPVFLKAGGEAPTASGFAVRYCPDREHVLRAVEWFRENDIQELIVEEALPIESSWCATIVVEQSRTAYIGAAEQEFEAPGKQCGSIIDEANPLPESGVQLAVMAGEEARKQGFVGVAGLDIGQTSNGELVVFDPNFRFNGSSVQVFLHCSAARRAGLAVSVSAQSPSSLTVHDLARALRGPIDDGWLVPTRVIDGTLLPIAEAASIFTGFILGADRADAAANREALERLLKP